MNTPPIRKLGLARFAIKRNKRGAQSLAVDNLLYELDLSYCADRPITLSVTGGIAEEAEEE